MALRREIGNLVPNGRFDIVPPFTAATTSNDRVIDGTAGGAHTDKYPSATKKLYGWKMNTYATTSPSVRYEDGALKVSGIACKERVNLTLGKRVYTDLNESNDIRYNLIPVTPSTSYTISVRMKTLVANAVGTPGLYGAMFRLAGHSGTGFSEMIRGITSATDNDKIAVTTDWTTYTRTFTTGASTRYINIDFGIYGDSSNYADITAWFDDIILNTTVPTTRTTATTRTIASNRVAVRDMGTALRFAGGADKVTRAGLLTDFDTLDYTFSVWVKSKLITTNVAGTSEIILGTGSGGAGAGTSYVYINLRNSLYQFRVQVISGTDSTASTPQLPGRWVHLVGTVTQADKKLRIYVNGTLKNTSSTFASFGTLLTSTLSIGGGFNTALSGEINDVRVWQSKALTATEIQNLYLHNIVPQDGLVAEYLFDEATGTTAIDSSGNGNDGTITGATYTTDVPLRLRTAV